MYGVTRRAAVAACGFIAFAGVSLAQLVIGATGAVVANPMVRVAITDAKVTLSPAAVTRGKVVLRIADVGRLAHALTIGGKSTPMLHHGATTFLTVSFAKAGSYKAVVRSGAGTAFSATLAVSAAAQTILPTVTTSPSKPSTTTAPAPNAACVQPTATTVTVTIVPPKFNFSQTTLPCGTVTFVVTNTGQLTHSLQITAPVGAPTIPANPPIQPGQTQTFTATMTAKGIYAWQCGEREDYSDDGEFGNLAVQ
jgi:hypothetical protein